MNSFHHTSAFNPQKRLKTYRYWELQRRNEIASILERLRPFLSAEGRKRKFRHNKYASFKCMGDFFVIAFITADVEVGNAPVLVSIHIKTLASDITLWTLTNWIQHLKNNPDVHRVWHDVAVEKHPICSLSFQVSDETDAGLKATSIEILRSIDQISNQYISSIGGTAEAFNQMIVSTPMEEQSRWFWLTKTLAMLELGEYLQAVRLALEDQDHATRSVNLSEQPYFSSIVAYCYTKMKEDSARYPDADKLPELPDQWWVNPSTGKTWKDPSKIPPPDFREIKDSPGV